LLQPAKQSVAVSSTVGGLAFVKDPGVVVPSTVPATITSERPQVSCVGSGMITSARTVPQEAIAIRIASVRRIRES
jgi:hypothetical protein